MAFLDSDRGRKRPTLSRVQPAGLSLFQQGRAAIAARLTLRVHSELRNARGSGFVVAAIPGYALLVIRNGTTRPVAERSQRVSIQIRATAAW